MLAKRRDPAARVVLLEAKTIGWAASGRNGGFCEASLTHGEENGRTRWPDEYDMLERMGLENLDAIERDVRELGMDSQLERTGARRRRGAPGGVAARAPGFLDREAVGARSTARSSSPASGPRRLRAGAPGAARPRAGPGRDRPRRRDPRGHPGDRARRAARGAVDVAHHRRLVASDRVALAPTSSRRCCDAPGC